MTHQPLDTFLTHVNDSKLHAILIIQNCLLLALQQFAVNEGFVQLLPILMSPITDPLNHQVYPAHIQYETHHLKLTASMIFHKQLALLSNHLHKIFIMAPNIRLEQDHYKSSNNHLLEFTQFDLEMKNANINDVMEFLERLYCYVFTKVEQDCAEQLTLLNRQLPTLMRPFPRYSTEDIPSYQVDEFCKKISVEAGLPSFILNFKREFYDKENQSKPGTYLNFDMVYPEGYGEAISGAEREHQYDHILRRMSERNMDLTPFNHYLEIARRNILPRTAGCGIGVQRLLKYITGQSHIAEVGIFDRSVASDLIF